MRKLPDDPLKRRRQYFKRLYQHLPHYQALRERGDIDICGIIKTPEGEDICMDDLMTGIDTLPPKQRQAFELICLLSYTETAATAIMLPDSKWSTPVQQYSDEGLDKMIRAYDLKQAGEWNPREAKRKLKVACAEGEARATATRDMVLRVFNIDNDKDKDKETV